MKKQKQKFRWGKPLYDNWDDDSFLIPFEEEEMIV